MNEGAPRQSRRFKNLWLAGAVLAAVLVPLFLLRWTDWPRESAFMAGIFVLAALLWVSEALPLFATALLVIGLQIVLLGNPGEWTGLGFEARETPAWQEVLQAAADPVLLLFFGGFVLAQAAIKEGVDKAMSALLLHPFGGRPMRVLLGVMLVTTLFSMFMSNTATTAMMMALIAPMLAQMPPGEPFRKAMALGVPFAANIGGMGTPIASPPNAVAVGFLEKAGYRVDFLDWMLVALPLVAGLLVVTWLLLRGFFPLRTAGLRIEAPSLEMTRRAWFVVVVFTVTVVLWLTDRWHGLPAAVVALLPAVAFTATGLITRNEVNRMEWNILILIAGGISLGAGMQTSGLDTIIAGWLPVSASGSGFGVLAALVLATVVVGSFMSNTAIANLLLPIGISVGMTAGPEGVGPVQMAVSIALAASVSMLLPISTPPNAIAYARGEFATRDMVRVAVVIGLLTAGLIVAFGGAVMRFWGVV